ncbi:MAG: hypothetical protein PWQ97_1595, partial [Tepidanaerobacteraceae bacterium]|nr:hypothetical protein [Tepidanaerobacteraceae bacterium]
MLLVRDFRFNTSGLVAEDFRIKDSFKTTAAESRTKFQENQP